VTAVRSSAGWSRGWSYTWNVAWRRRSLRVVSGLALVAAVAMVAEPIAARVADQIPIVSGGRFAGLEWTFVRVRYNSWAMDEARFRQYWNEPWAIDAPAAEQNLSRRLSRITSIQVHDPIVLTLDDPRIWEYPWLYFVEPGNLELQPGDVETLREFLARGGTITFDDFHGPLEWDHFVAQVGQIVPGREIVELDTDHPIFHCFYSVDKYPQIPGLGAFFSGRTWEKGGFVPRLRAVLDDDGRPMMLINWNTDMGDGWEWSNAEEYPGYIQYTGQSYRMMINEIIYALTH
jgi:hypothetical protein